MKKFIAWFLTVAIIALQAACSSAPSDSEINQLFIKKLESHFQMMLQLDSKKISDIIKIEHKITNKSEVKDGRWYIEGYSVATITNQETALNMIVKPDVQIPTKFYVLKGEKGWMIQD